MSDLDHGSEPNISPDELSQRRRALIKGSAIAVPAILTLRSGSALAATSASCLLAPGQANPPGVVDAILTGDDWLRQSTKCRTIKSGGTTKHVFKDPNTALDRWYEYDPVANTGNNSNAGNYWTTTSGNDTSGQMKYQGTGAGYSYPVAPSTVGTTTCYVLVQLNADGTKSGVVGAPTLSAYLATESCYDSIS